MNKRTYTGVCVAFFLFDWAFGILESDAGGYYGALGPLRIAVVKMPKAYKQ